MKKLFFPYLLANYPTWAEFVELLDLTIQYADAIEIGVPFSDPVADGPVIREAAEKVLRNEFQMDSLFQCLQSRKGKIPIAVMTYANPVLAYGRCEFLKACRDCGVQSLIVPDVPFEECESWKEETNASDLKWIQFVSLLTRKERLQKIAASAEGFIYLLSLTGITGAQISNSKAIQEKALEIRQHTNVPIALGFGIKSPGDAVQYFDFVDAFIVGSRIIELIRDRESLESFYREFRAVLQLRTNT